jgi:hypothetical protein
MTISRAVPRTLTAILLSLAVLISQIPATALAKSTDAKGASTLKAFGTKGSKKAGAKKPANAKPKTLGKRPGKRPAGRGHR